MTSRLIGAIALVCIFATAASARPVTHAEQLDEAVAATVMSCGEVVHVWAPVASVEHGFAPCLSWLKVVNLETGKSVPVQVIDDNQFPADGITILLSPQAADLIGMKERANVLIVPLRNRTTQ